VKSTVSINFRVGFRHKNNTVHQVGCTEAVHHTRAVTTQSTQHVDIGGEA
jgi:nitrogenase subunit NifH